MRVLHAVHNFPPEFVGGTEAYLAALCEAQRRVGDEVLVVTGSGVAGPPIADEDLDGTPVRRLHHDPAVERYSVDLSIPRLASLFEQIVTDWRPDLVHVHHYFNLGIPMVAMARGLGIPAIVSLHDFTSICPRFFLIRPDGFFCGDETPIPLARCLDCCGTEFDGSRDAMEGEFASRRRFFAHEIEGAGGVILPSERALRFVSASVILPTVPMEVLPLGLLNALSPVARVASPDGRLRVVFFGNIAPVKGVEWLLQAVDQLDDARRAQVSVLLLGHATDDDLSRRIDTFAPRVALKREERYDAARLERLPAEADVAIFPGAAAETYSLVVDEALALGLPLVLSDRGAAAERAGDAALVVKTGDVLALRDAIARLVDEPSRLDTMRRHALARTFTIDDHATQLRAIYDRISAARTSRHSDGA